MMGKVIGTAGTCLQFRSTVRTPVQMCSIVRTSSLTSIFRLSLFTSIPFSSLSNRTRITLLREAVVEVPCCFVDAESNCSSCLQAGFDPGDAIS